MNETKNYQLQTAENEKTRFLDWRQAMDANMFRIDSVLADKADNSRAIIETLHADQWTQSGSVFTQVITIEGLTPEQNGLIGMAQNVSEGQLEAVRSAGLYISQQSEGSLTIASDGETPSCDIPVVIILLG